MELKSYFDRISGLGILSTADRRGRVDAAVYSRPHIMEDGTMAFIMNDRLTHQYLQSNPRASFLFKEDGKGYKGKRFFLTKIREEQDTDLLKSLRRRTYPDKSYKGPKFLVFFKVDKELPLVGSDEEEV